MTVSDAYRILSDAYPNAVHPRNRKGIREVQGQAKLRALSTVIHTDADLAEALTLIPDEAIREIIRQGLRPMLDFTPKE